MICDFCHHYYGFDYYVADSTPIPGVASYWYACIFCKPSVEIGDTAELLKRAEHEAPIVARLTGQPIRSRDAIRVSHERFWSTVNLSRNAYI